MVHHFYQATKVEPGRMSLSQAPDYRPFAHTNTFKSEVHSLYCRVLLLNYRPMLEGRAGVAPASNNLDLGRSIWHSTVDTEIGAIALFWGGTQRCLCHWATSPRVVVRAGLEPALDVGPSI